MNSLRRFRRLGLPTMFFSLGLLVGCAGTATLTDVGPNDPATTVQPLAEATSTAEPIVPTITLVPAPTPVPAPTSAPPPAPTIVIAPTPTAEPVPNPTTSATETTDTSDTSESADTTETTEISQPQTPNNLDDRLAALGNLAIDFIDPQKLNGKIRFDSSSWNELGSAELFQGEAASAQKIPEVGADLHEWCREGVHEGSPRAAYWSRSEWLSTGSEVFGTAWVWTSTYDSTADASNFIERNRLAREHCAGEEILYEYEDEPLLDARTHVTTVHTTPAGLLVDFTADLERDSGWLAVSLQAGPVVSRISVISVPDESIPTYLVLIDAMADDVVTAFEQEFASNGTPVVAASTAGGEASVGAYPRAESPWLNLVEFFDPATMPKIEADRVDALLDEYYDERADSFDDTQRECLAVQIAVGERNTGRPVPSVIVPFYARYCAPDLHADWWAEGDRITLDDPDERRCLAHVVFHAEAAVADAGLLELSWPDLEPSTRYVVLKGLSTHCGLSEADAVRAGLTPTAPVEISPQLPAYCRAVEVHDSWRVSPPSMLEFFEKLVEIYQEVDPPPTIAESFRAFQAFNRDVASVLADEPDTDQWALAELPGYIAATETYNMDTIRAEIEEFNRINCVTA